MPGFDVEASDCDYDCFESANLRLKFGWVAEK